MIMIMIRVTAGPVACHRILRAGLRGPAAPGLRVSPLAGRRLGWPGRGRRRDSTDSDSVTLSLPGRGHRDRWHPGLAGRHGDSLTRCRGRCCGGRLALTE